MSLDRVDIPLRGMIDDHLLIVPASHEKTPRGASQVPEDQGLGRVGEKQILKRRFGFLSILGFSCTILASWEGILSTLIISFEDGGPAGTVYCFLIVWLSTFSTFLTLSELVSMTPTSGGQYHRVSVMSPVGCQRYLSFLTGWLIIISWLGAFTSTCYLSASQIQGLVVLNHAFYVPAAWQTFEGFVLILHILGFFAIIIPLLYLGSHNEASDVFTEFRNDGGFQSEGLAFMVGMTGAMFSFTGADTAVHMSEEIHNAERVVPHTLFTMTDVDSALKFPTGYPYMQVFCSATSSVGGCTVMSAIVPILVTATAVGSLASSSRMVNTQAVPQWSVLVVTIAAILLAPIILGSAAVLNDVVSLCVSALYTSYLISACLLMWRRYTGGIRDPAATVMDTLVNTPGAPLAWGPFRIRGVLGVLVNAFTVATMNWAVVGTAGTSLISTIYYIIWDGKVYTGPVMEINRD
ncbi:uncharacterized protein BP01DRAFT_375697 [Aspergillus saccharolyticus JOP 1030-1]|uniref:Amino acid transporter n=1 Tax=Aspergillus saccharolyticus JOP 1030-1 TaxID=1450539 RepID=A0A318Z6Y2_9EURO|nr:hypothetical protein BP01DRAFT_375697 [Aspergillus saccharolyticus JOP 1030-1]PYH43085.1 hypothetical protein BP01DRAFT_375697 [Aspergillus saccharolyticus JOP 1030-1]